MIVSTNITTVWVAEALDTDVRRIDVGAIGCTAAASDAANLTARPSLTFGPEPNNIIRRSDVDRIRIVALDLVGYG